MEKNTKKMDASVARNPRVSEKNVKSDWERATAEGVMTVEEFVDKCRKRYEERFGKVERA